MKIKSTHVKQTGDWVTPNVWGNITIEPKESFPRWMVSTIVPFDNNVNSPIYPLAGLYVTVTYPQPDTAVMECYFDPSKIDLTNGVKVTAKIKESCDPVQIIGKLTSGNTKIIA